VRSCDKPLQGYVIDLHKNTDLVIIFSNVKVKNK